MKNVLREKIKEFPQVPGVYFFKNSNGEIIYIGKASSLRDRVNSYLTSNLSYSRSPWIAKMLEESVDVECQRTSSVLEALILEANLIKEHQPVFNSKDKDNKSFNYVVITKEKYPTVQLMRGRELEKDNIKKPIAFIFGPFPQGGVLKEALRIIRKIFPYRDEKCTPAEEQKNEAKPCFDHQVGLCPGTCTGQITLKEYKRRIYHLRLFFQGKKEKVIRDLEKERDRFSQNEEFEKAAEVQKRIKALQFIRDISLLNKGDFEGSSSEDLKEDSKDKEQKFRIEGYDIAHISGSFVVGGFSVLEEGDIKKDQYRKFRIKEAPGVDDTGALREVVRRRMKHAEWRSPDLVVVDGGVAQRNAVLDVLEEVGAELPVIAVSKDKNHRPFRYHGERSIVEGYKQDIIKANMEAHRFVTSYHRKLREKI